MKTSVMQNDSEKEKMRSALGSAIMMEKPNVKVTATPQDCINSIHILTFILRGSRLPEISPN